MERKYDSIIVGAGIAGLTAAAYLSRSGRKTLLIEKNKECGGLVNSFKVNGFHFDAGVRALEDAGIIFPMLKDLNIDLEFVKSPVSVGVEKEILNIKDIHSLGDYKAMLIKLYPESTSEIEKTIKVIRKIMKHMEVLYGLENPVFKDLKKDLKFIFRQLLPWLPKFVFTVGKINRMNEPVEDFLSKIISNQALKDIISQHFFKNTPTFFALSYFSLYLDYFYPKGGVGKLAEKMEDKILAYGGDILKETQIAEVNAANRELIDLNGQNYYYDNLVWAADLKTLYTSTNTNGLDPGIQKAFETVKSNMLKTRGSDSIFTLFLQIDEPLETFKSIANGHFFYTPSKKGLGETHRSELKGLLGKRELDKAQILAWLDKFTALNTYEISIPGLKDSSLVPSGKTGMIVSFLAEYDLFKRIKEEGWYESFNTELETRILAVLSNTIYPGLSEKILDSFSFSPLSIQNRVGSSEGAITGWSFEKPVPVINKIHIADRSVLTPISTIFQAGQWAYSPAGVPMCILTGKLAFDRIEKMR